GGASTGHETSNQQLIDINGDGLPDLLRSDGTARLSTFPQDAQHRITSRDGVTFSQVGVTSLPTLSKVATWSSTLSFGVHFPGELGGGGSSVESRTLQDQGLVDMNGDGLPDFFAGQTALLNTSRGTALQFSSSPDWTGLDADHFPVSG